MKKVFFRFVKFDAKKKENPKGCFFLIARYIWTDLTIWNLYFGSRWKYECWCSKLGSAVGLHRQNNENDAQWIALIYLPSCSI